MLPWSRKRTPGGSAAPAGPANNTSVSIHQREVMTGTPPGLLDLQGLRAAFGRPEEPFTPATGQRVGPGLPANREVEISSKCIPEHEEGQEKSNVVGLRLTGRG